MNNNLLIAFKNRQYFYLWLAEIFTQVSVNVLNFLLILVVFNLTESNTAVSVIVLSFTLPAVFLGIIAGVYTDKWNKKKVLFVTNFVRAILLIILIFFTKNVFVIYSISFIFGIITQFFIPAETPLIPIIVKKEELLSANALFGIGIFGSVLVAYLISGPLLLYLGLTNTLMLLALSLVVGGFFISRIKVPISEEIKHFSILKPLPLVEVKAELRMVFKTIYSTRHVFSSLVLLAMSQILFFTIAAIAPGYANEVLHIRVEQFPLLVITPAALGIVVGAIIIANKLNRKRKKDLITLGVFLSSLAFLLMPYGSKIASRKVIVWFNEYLPQYLHITYIDVIIILAFVLGFANALVFIPANTYLQEATDDTIRGKIYGVLNTFVGVFSFTPILLVGSFSDLIGVSSVVMGIGISLLLITLVRFVFNRFI